MSVNLLLSLQSGIEMEEIIIITPEQLKKIIDSCLAQYFKEETSVDPPDIKDEYLKSIVDLAEFLGCSNATAQKFKNRNRHIFLQVGRKFLVRKTDVIDSLRKKSHYHI